MTFNITIPKLGVQNSSVKNAIISILANEWPLSAKEIHNRLQKNHGLTISYQAVHKALNEMEPEGILEKNGKNYSICETWITNLNTFSSELEKKYQNNCGKYEIDSAFDGTIQWKFTDFSLLVVTMADLLAKRTLMRSKDVGPLGILRHIWWPLEFKFSDIRLLQKMIKNNPTTYMLYKYNDPFDQWCKKEYMKLGWTGIKQTADFDKYDDEIMIHGDSIITYEYSEESKKIIDNFYQKTKNIADLFKEYVNKKSQSQKVDISVKITKDPQMADMLRKQILSYFK